MPSRYDHCDVAAKKIIDHVGKTIVIGVPLGIGKPIGLLNALYRLASADPTMQLTIITGLTLARPTLQNELEQRLVDPILDRLLKDYEDPLYEKAREMQQLPPNINVIEFFLAPGKYLHNSYVQQHYINSTYTSVVHDSMHFSVNVLAQQVAYSSAHPNQYSLSSNTDIFKAAAEQLQQLAAQNQKIAIVAEVNTNMPYMHGDALVNFDAFTDIIDTGHYRALFALPRDELSCSDHLIGLYTSTLIPDDSCLQIGIGKLSSAVTNALIMRQQHNADYQELCQQFSMQKKFGDTITSLGSLADFNKGLYASTEMLSDDYLSLYNEGILKKRVYDHIGLQTLLNAGTITETITPAIIDILLENRLIHTPLSADDFSFLQQFGILLPDISYQEDHLLLSSGEKLSTDITSSTAKNQLIDKCLGKHLRTGKFMHAGFFMGSGSLYQQLRELPDEILQQIDMTSIARTNSLLWSPELLRLQRTRARLVNSSMIITLGGALVSDGLKNLQEVSGVGGQFDFINMAQQLPGAASIVTCRSTRKSKNRLVSNVVWDYPYITIPRYLRDVVVTEYGIASCRSKTDADVIKAILNITDSRFQESLLNTAKKYGKVPLSYEIPEIFQHNTPDVITPIMREWQRKGYCKPYPFGTELTIDELVIKKALLNLKNCSRFSLIVVTLKSLCSFAPGTEKYLNRMQLQSPKSLKEWIYKKLLSYMISATQ